MFDSDIDLAFDTFDLPYDAIVKFARLADNVKLPTKREGDGCYDVYAHFDKDMMVIQPHTCKLIPTGLKSAFNHNYRIAIRERGSNTKSNMITMAGQIDSNFRGEWFIAIYNGNDIPLAIDKNTQEVTKTDDFILVPYTKAIAQFAVEPVPNIFIQEVTVEDIDEIESERGTGMLGSSQK